MGARQVAFLAIPFLLGFPASALAGPVSSSTVVSKTSTAAVTSSSVPALRKSAVPADHLDIDCATNLITDGSFENLQKLTDSKWLPVSENGAACDIVNDGYNSSGHALWVYNPRLSSSATCTISQTLPRLENSVEAVFNTQLLGRKQGSGIMCNLKGPNGTINIVTGPNIPADGRWVSLFNTISLKEHAVYLVSCTLSAPPDGSLRVDDISLITKGPKCATNDVKKAPIPAVGNYKFAGCQTESSTHRILPGDEFVSDGMTAEKCADFCKDWPFFGLEYGRECYCGENVARDSSPTALSQCSMPCSGNKAQLCGGPDRVSLYHDESILGPVDPPRTLDGTSGFLGCYTEVGRSGGFDRTLEGASYASRNQTLASCEKFCITSGLKTSQKRPFKYWGLEYGSECYCSDSIRATAAKVDDNDCAQVCSGDRLHVCGGPNLLSVYQYMGALLNGTKAT